MSSWAERIARCMQGTPHWSQGQRGWVVRVVGPGGSETSVVASSPESALLQAYHLIEEILIREVKGTSGGR